MKLHHIALSGQSQPIGGNRQSPQDEQIAPFFPLLCVMGSLMKQLSIHGSDIFAPLMFDVDQRPLAAAKDKMLQTGQQQIILFPVRHFLIPFQDFFF